MLIFNIKNLLKTRQVEKPHAFLVKAGLSSHSAHNILNAHSRVYRLDHIEKLCEILHCEPNDLLTYVPDSNKILADNHPLHKLTPKNEEFDWQHTLKTLPLEELKEVAKFISQSKQNKEIE
ncbi:helix-turn-helix domain-containing protein [Flavobacterium phycosphaerae]|uniref:helix-turn-helix domain-containing protein n=1 Tax=Flavobacterium phycosphaerae TaxID=2697515 RepID=UPI001389A84C|nr:helix-turn-helix transcriptional regulator [Flavobacterium phycosphaerae]